MSETFVTFMGLGIITTVQYIFIYSHLDRLEKKINELMADQEVKEEHQPTTKNDLAVDCISREQAINAVNMCSNSETILNLQQLPSMGRYDPYTDKFIKE